MNKLFMCCACICFLVSFSAFSQKKKLISKPELLKNYDLVPVDKIFKSKKITLKSYKKIIVKDVFTEKDVKDSKVKNKNKMTWLSKEDKEVATFARFTKIAFENAIKKDPRWQLATKPDTDTLIIELMLINIVPGKPLVGIARNVPVGFIFGKSATLASSAITGAKMLGQSNKKTTSFLDASIGIEGIIRDSISNKIIVMVQDHESQKAAVFNAKDFSAYGNLEQIVQEWADLLIECLDKRPLETGEKVVKKSKLKLLN
jgi:hypothetical protein